MANVKFEVAKFDLTTAGAGNTQDIEIAGFGEPKAALFFVSGATTLATAKADHRMSIGVADGTRQWCMATWSLNGFSTSDSSRISSTSRVITGTNSSDTEVFGMSFDSWTTNGVRISVDDQASSAYKGYVILIGGTDVASAYAGNASTGTTTSAVDHTAAGFEPDLLFMGTIGRDTPDDSATNGVLSFGAALNDGAATQASSAYFVRVNQNTSQNFATASNTAAVSFLSTSAIIAQTTVGFGSDKFTTTQSASFDRDFFYLALEFTNSPDIDLFSSDVPTTSPWAETTPNFEPTFGLVVGSSTSTNYDVWDDTGQQAFFASAFDEDNLRTVHITDRDNIQEMDSKSFAFDSFTARSHISATVRWDSSTTSGYFTTTGWEFTLDTTPSGASKVWGLAVRDTGGATGPEYNGAGTSVYTPDFKGSGSGTYTAPSFETYLGTGTAVYTPDFIGAGIGTYIAPGVDRYIGIGTSVYTPDFIGVGSGTYANTYSGQGAAIYVPSFSALGSGGYTLPLGVLAEDVPSTGTDGPAFSYFDLSFPDDTGKYVNYAIIQPPSGVISFTTYPDTSFSMEANPGAYAFSYDLYLDGIYRGRFTRNILVE